MTRGRPASSSKPRRATRDSRSAVTAQPGNSSKVRAARMGTSIGPLPRTDGRPHLGLLLELPAQRENVELAARAEAAGFDSVWAPEFHNHSGALALAAAALRTESVELGTGIAWAFGRSPLLTAVTALDLDEMSGGRCILGLGTGTRRMRTDWLDAPAEPPARRARETVQADR